MTKYPEMMMVALPISALDSIIRDAFLAGVDHPDLSDNPETQAEAELYAARIVAETSKPALNEPPKILREFIGEPDPCAGFKEQRDQWADGALNAESGLEHERRVSEFMFLANGAILIPAGTKPRKCHGKNCNAMIYDVPPAKEGGKFRPVSIAKYGDNPIGIPPTDTADGAGISHFADCPDAPTFHRGKR